MTFAEDDGQIAPERLVALLAEQGMASDEIAHTAPMLHRLPEWSAPVPALVQKHALMARLATQAAPTSPQRRWRWGWQIFRRQPRLIHASLWGGATVGIALAAVLAALRWSIFGLTQPGGTLQLLLPLIAAISAAYLYGPESDEGWEIALATPVAARAIVCCRLVLLVGFELALGLVATEIVATVHHADFGMLASLWLVPGALLVACSLLLALLFGSVIAAASLALGWLSQFVQVSTTAIITVTPPTWLAQPPILLLAIGILLLALLMWPHWEAWARRVQQDTP
jgi:hypothetical protein